MKPKSILVVVIASTLFTFTANAQQSRDQDQRKEPPSVDEIFEHMDENEDGKLSKEEVKGPLKEMFTKIDTNEDGYLSKKEVEEAPKPEGRRPRQ
ncbi:EF hand domain-containing protein [Jejuia pallidilutea]|uniref:EF hand domain-containing protein n=1 Tax=Jejuia pallidilutea TaxID=504487 RepID=A0A362X2F5_9FLAO|nr:EF-hand domain-containing protein [Jejuia pallidilutea]PQV47799.1 EF hand domain-containing protein [Jejuia pallidilutea]